MERTLARTSSAMRPVSRISGIAVWMMMLLAILPIPHVEAQIKYSPDDAAVQQIAKRGIDFLNKRFESRAEEKLSRDALLCGLAAIEYAKRYNEPLPIDGPLVSRALAYANKAIDPQTETNSFRTKNNIYEQALALIIYCEVDDVQYKSEIETLLNIIQGRQQRDGAINYVGREGRGGDTSQTQYAALSLWVAKEHGFKVDIQVGKRLLTWLCNEINKEGTWYYHSKDQKSTHTESHFRPSLHCSGLSSTYLLADFLQLNGRKNGGANQVIANLGLPPSVSIHVPNAEGKVERKTGPLTNFDRGKLRSTQLTGNKWLADNWTLKSEKWNFYYLYALERYAYFREAAEQEVSEIPTWYDQGVDHLKSVQTKAGNWSRDKNNSGSSATINTAFAIMFLVRASEVLAGDTVEGVMNGNVGFAVDKKLTFNKDGTVSAQSPIKGVEDVLGLLEAGVDDNDLDFVLQSLAPVIGQMADRTDKSHSEQLAFLRGLLSDQNPRMRQIAVRLLAGQQAIENAPALIYALSDNAYDVRIEAHNGLRLISRRIDTIKLPENPSRQDFESVKGQWTDWYLSVNPGAKLLE